MPINPKDYIYDTELESVANYGEGGLCPIHIDALFKDDRYQILNKLGTGAFSTVWAARDHKKNINVAIKVIRADHSENNQELRILQHLQKGDPQHPGYKHIPRLLDYFYHITSKKRNLFIVIELLGPSIQAVMGSLPNRNFSLPCSRRISTQMLLAIEFFHSRGVVHGDLYESNILFKLPDDFQLVLDDVRKASISRKDNSAVDEGVPEYLVKPLEIEDQIEEAQFEKFDHIQIIDFSSSFFEPEPPKVLRTPVHASPPEWIFEKPLGKAVDIWGLACITFYCATDQVPFSTLGSKLTLIPIIYKFLGESSAHWLLTQIIDSWDDVSKLRFSYFQDQLTLNEALTEWHENGQGRLSEAEKQDLSTLEQYLRKAFVVDPLSRPTAQELKKEKWVAECQE